jgi:3-hydroxyisobutyrate dehydrogenase-like beta-hydroxyacid dehydrogenase
MLRNGIHLEAFFKLKKSTMKKLLALLTITGALIACNNAAKESDASKDSAATTDTSSSTMAPAKDTSTTMSAAPVKDSVMQFKDGKVMIMAGGSWSALSATVTTSNGRKVSPDGEVSKNGKKRKMEEGMMIDKDGQLMDKEGKPMDTTGWE